MAQFGMGSVLAMAALAMLNNAGPLAAQTDSTAKAKDKSIYATCSDGTKMPRIEDCNKKCSDGRIVPESVMCPKPMPTDQKLCQDGRRIPADQICPPPPPVTSRCPNKIVVPYGKQCPMPNAERHSSEMAVTPLSPKTKTAYWVPQSAYPREALQEMAEGTVGFSLNVGPDGKPTQCHVTSSSGNDPLDWATCENVMRRAQFNPAIDAKGQPVAGTYRSRVRWAIPDGQRSSNIGRDGLGDFPPLLGAFGQSYGKRRPAQIMLSVDVVVNADGTRASCSVAAERVDDGKVLSLDDGRKEAMCKNLPSPLLNENGEPMKSRFKFSITGESSFLPDEPSTPR